MEIKDTGFGNFIIVIGWIHFALSIIGGVFLYSEFSYNDALIMVAIGVGIAGCFMGLCIVGFGKIINYLHSINYYASQLINSSVSSTKEEENTPSSELPDL